MTLGHAGATLQLPFPPLLDSRDSGGYPDQPHCSAKSLHATVDKADGPAGLNGDHNRGPSHPRPSRQLTMPASLYPPGC